MSILKKLIEAIIHRRLAITILMCGIIITKAIHFGIIYRKLVVNHHHEFNRTECDLFVEKLMEFWSFYIIDEILAPIFGKWGAEVVFYIPFLITYLTFAEIFLKVEKELKIRIYYPLKKMWLRRITCSLSEISNGVYKINSSSNVIENAHQLGSQTFAQFMAYRIIQGTNHLLL